MLDGMNKIQPLDKSFSDDLYELFQDEQALVRLEQQIEHVHKAVFGSGMKISKTEANDLVNMHAHAAQVYGQAANKAKSRMHASERSGNPAMTAKLGEIHNRLRRMAQDHHDKTKQRQESVGLVSESVDKKKSLLSEFRLLAGLDEQVSMPIGTGLSETVRANAGYVNESEKWASNAVKHPGRLHAYFKIPEGQKIPMDKIKAAYDKLKDKKDKSAEETSLMHALALGIRFKGGDVPGGEKKKGLAGS